MVSSTFVVESATHFGNLDSHDTAPHENVIKKPEVDFQEVISPTISTST